MVMILRELQGGDEYREILRGCLNKNKTKLQKANVESCRRIIKY
jgi:hypothetical protein